jgi:hypothetical protein
MNNNSNPDDSNESKDIKTTTTGTTETTNASDSDNDSDSSSSDDDEKAKIPTIKEMKPTSKEIYFFNNINKYFVKIDNKKINVMLNIINGCSLISLRLLDWFVTRYAKKEKISYDLKNAERFNVHISYKSQLKSYKKRYFDPFRRRKKFLYTVGNVNLVTTIGQLNFFKWIFLNDVVEYVEKHFEKISKAMITSNKEDKERKNNSKKNNKEEKDEKIQKNKISEKSNILSFD